MVCCRFGRNIGCDYWKLVGLIMAVLLIKVKENIPGEFSNYSGWGGYVANSHYTAAQGWCHEVIIAPPPNFDLPTVNIWLPELLLIFI